MSAQLFHQGRKILTPEEVQKIVRLYSVELLTQSTLARRFGVSQATIKDALDSQNVKKPNRTLTVL